MANYFHGVSTRQNDTSISTPVTADSGIAFVVGAAPGHTVDGAPNDPIMCQSYAEAVAALGYSDDWEKYPICEAMVTKGIMSVVRQIPAGAKFTVEVCNNGNDASPTWEDVTQNVVSGSKFFLSNTTKTASAWGYNFRIKVKRGTATGDCFITSAGGNFE